MDRIVKCGGWWIVASNYHDGQNSYLYSKLSQLSRIGYSPGLASWRNERGSEERQHAARILRSLKPMLRHSAPHP